MPTLYVTDKYTVCMQLQLRGRFQNVRGDTFLQGLFSETWERKAPEFLGFQDPCTLVLWKSKGFCIVL